jgi:WD40 repeat protein
VRPDNVQTTGLCWSPDSAMIATVGMDHDLKLWDTASGKELAAVNGNHMTIQTVRFSPDGRWLATAAWNDQDIRLWPLVKPAQAN